MFIYLRMFRRQNHRKHCAIWRPRSRPPNVQTYKHPPKHVLIYNFDKWQYKRVQNLPSTNGYKTRFARYLLGKTYTPWHATKCARGIKRHLFGTPLRVKKHGPHRWNTENRPKRVQNELLHQKCFWVLGSLSSIKTEAKGPICTYTLVDVTSVAILAQGTLAQALVSSVCCLQFREFCH